MEFLEIFWDFSGICDQVTVHEKRTDLGGFGECRLTLRRHGGTGAQNGMLELLAAEGGDRGVG